MSLPRSSLIEWASHWVPEANRGRFAAALEEELKDWTAPKPKPDWCKNCPFSRHVHYPEGDKLVAPGCPGFELDETKGK